MDAQWQNAFVPPLKKAIQVYLEHDGIKGMAEGAVVGPTRVLNSRSLTKNGTRDPPGAELRLVATRIRTQGFIRRRVHAGSLVRCIQRGWTVYYEDGSAAFLQGRQLPRTEKIYVKVVRGYWEDVLDFMRAGLGGNVRTDLVELTKAGFGFSESEAVVLGVQKHDPVPRSL